MRNHRVLSVILVVVVFALAWHLLSVLIANLEMLVLLGAVGAGFRYWGTNITPADDVRRIEAAWHRHRRIDPPDLPGPLRPIAPTGSNETLAS